MKKGDVILEEMERLKSGQERFKYLLEFSFDYLKTNKHHSKLMVSLSLQIEDFPKLKDIVLARYRGIMPLMSMLFEELGVDRPKEEALTVAAAMDGIALQYLVIGDEIPLDEFKEYLIQKYCK